MRTRETVTSLFVLEPLGLLELALCVSFQVDLREDALQKKKERQSQRSEVRTEINSSAGE